jgi:hypothetical protein
MKRKVDIGYQDDFFTAISQMLCQLKGDKLGAARLPAGRHYPPAYNENPQDPTPRRHAKVGMAATRLRQNQSLQ